MQNKVCKKCKKDKDIEQFYKNNNKKDGYSNICKECIKKYYQLNKEKIIQRQRDYYKNNKEKVDLKKKEYRKTNKEKIKKQRQRYYKKNKEIFIKKAKERYLNNKDEIYIKAKVYRKERKINDKNYKLKEQIRNMIYKSFSRKGYIKSDKTEKIIGINHREFYKYLIKTFKDNYGYEWDGIEKVHIDHIVPLSKAKNEKQIIELCNYKNLQLLKAKDNLEKSDSLNWKIRKG